MPKTKKKKAGADKRVLISVRIPVSLYDRLNDMAEELIKMPDPALQALASSGGRGGKASLTATIHYVLEEGFAAIAAARAAAASE